MGSFATLRLGCIHLGSTKNEIDPGLIWLFRPSDKHIESIDRRNREKLAEYVCKEYIDDYDEDEPFHVVEYRCTATAARDRLDLKGYTYRAAEAAFRYGIAEEIKNLDRYAKQDVERFDEKIKLLQSLTVDKWLDALRRIIADGLRRNDLDTLLQSDPQLLILRHMLGSSTSFYGFPSYELRHFVRLAVEVAPSHEALVYDLTDLVAGGWVDELDECVTYAEYLINEDFLLAHRVIVLTEGVSDRRFLARSLELLYPHLSDYFRFFDYAGHKVGGGAGELANLVRAFAAADVKHRILALFDNDTAARQALSKLDVDALPQNIVVCHYPDLDVAREYPTLGPSGTVAMDVNGLAGSIELYLGEDVLRNSDGLLTPIQWTGYDRKQNAYQGEILDKDKIGLAFVAKLESCALNPEKLDSYDWEGIRAILNVIRSAFTGVDEEAILNEIRLAAKV